MLFGKKKRRINNILIVEDEPLVAFDTEHFLGDEGFSIVDTTDSVIEARSVLEGPMPVDLVLVDVKLNDGSGIDVAQAAHAAGVLVLFVTGNCPAEARELAAGCLSKPYTQRDLMTAIDAIEAVAEGRKPKKLPANFSLFDAAA
ncbi:response regulator [Stakelama saccharophila]|uniref:Response regulator n=1 Tax=Stakelama saccharophila TaxID=3075605 RepID=A0ABZ0BCY2_9SPHN|nr:response regulator [Stakelama sp. W311]WNO54955.1 response regulator [Stakelama sp. W311]